jgi:N-glycosylase/DNA lyase
MPGKGHIDELTRDYHVRKPIIEKRLAEFMRVYQRGDRAIFEELCFCILTAGSSARMGMKSIEAMKDLLFSGSERELQQRAHAHHVRFWRLRPHYIVETREYLRETCRLRLRKLLDGFEDRRHDRRDFFAANKSIKGLSYKESSHFLRNIGFSGYAILDKHIIASMHELGIIRQISIPANRDQYLKMEEKLATFAQRIGIDMDHLDLLLWSRKTGEILK